MKPSLPLHIHISSLFVTLILAVGGLIGGTGYLLSRHLAEATANDVVKRVARETMGEIRNLVKPAEMAIDLARHDPLTTAQTLTERMRRLPFVQAALENSATLSSFYIGYDTGDFFFVRRLHDEAGRARLGAPPATRYVVQSIERNLASGTNVKRVTPARGRFIFLDADLKILRQDERLDYPATYDPRQRGWFKEVMASGGQIKTAPYLFFSDRQVGITLAGPSAPGTAVIGADILLETLANSLGQQKITPGSHIALVDAAGAMLAHPNVDNMIRRTAAGDGQPQLPHLTESGIPILTEAVGMLATASESTGPMIMDTFLEADRRDWRIAVHTVSLDNAPPLYLVMAMPKRELLTMADRQRNSAVLMTLLVLLIAIPTTWVLARRISRQLRKLLDSAEAIRRFDFSSPITVRSQIREVHELARTMDDMKRTIRRFIDINTAMVAEDNLDKLLPHLLGETIAAAHADAGVLYLLSDDERLTAVSAMRADGSLLVGDAPDTLPPVELGVGQRQLLKRYGPLMGAAILDRRITAADFQREDIAGLGLERVGGDTRPSHGIVVPLLDRKQNMVGVVLLLLTAPSDEAQRSFVEALSVSAAIAIETQELIQSQKNLFDAFIQLIAGAIDAKSHRTGGHCKRVPDLTKMLARAACDAHAGPYANFTLDESEWEAVHVAAWLHDCGKVTTPEFVVDKATKLETIYDRIHEIRMRFELIKRETEIHYLEALVAGDDPVAARRRRDEECRKLDDDFAFVAHCNEGNDLMGPAQIERLHAIAQRTWTRTLDDRLGISREERARKARTPVPVLPVVEPLLADKAEHLIERPAEERIALQNPWGFEMAVPTYLYNRGEIHNLGVARGTLSDEERYKVNEHIVYTENMLRQLPFPRHLRKVPEIAAAHHEKLDGSGYPRQLTHEQMSPITRMIAIADIFEALTANDRPYKKNKTLSEAIKIMTLMRDDRHIDPDLFDLFLQSGAYLEYARRYLRPEQIDEVRIEALLRPGVLARQNAKTASATLPVGDSGIDTELTTAESAYYFCRP